MPDQPVRRRLPRADIIVGIALLLGIAALTAAGVWFHILPDVALVHRTTPDACPTVFDLCPDHERGDVTAPTLSEARP